jgi:hypothetical protein
MYGWTGQQSGSGVSDIARPALGVFASLDRFELSSSCTEVPCYALNLNRNILDFMRWPHIDLGAQNLNGFNGQNVFQKLAGSKVRDEYYNPYRRKTVQFPR